MLGHANISITLDLYSHVLPDLKKEAATKLNHFFDSRTSEIDEDEPSNTKPDNKSRKITRTKSRGMNLEI